MIGFTVKEGVKIRTKLLSCKQTYFGAINLALIIRCKRLLKQTNEKTNGQIKKQSF